MSRTRGSSSHARPIAQSRYDDRIELQPLGLVNRHQSASRPSASDGSGWSIKVVKPTSAQLKSVSSRICMPTVQLHSACRRILGGIFEQFRLFAFQDRLDPPRASQSPLDPTTDNGWRRSLTETLLHGRSRRATQTEASHLPAVSVTIGHTTVRIPNQIVRPCGGGIVLASQRVQIGQAQVHTTAHAAPTSQANRSPWMQQAPGSDATRSWTT